MFEIFVGKGWILSRDHPVPLNEVFNPFHLMIGSVTSLNNFYKQQTLKLLYFWAPLCVCAHVFVLTWM